MLQNVYLEAVNRRRIDNTMVKDKNVKKKTGTNNDLQSTTQKTKHLAIWTQSKPGVNSIVINANLFSIKFLYYIDRCELCGFIREINSGIFTCENISFFPSELLLHNYKCGSYVACCVTANTHMIVNWKNSAKCHWRLWHITNMTSLTSYEDFQFET